MTASVSDAISFLEKTRERRLNSYRSTPEDINAHYSDEGQIQADYHKRFAFELIQNADDAMSDVDGSQKVRFELDGNTLLVANTGRPVNQKDVRALCTMSYTTKDASGDQEAPIGHKGRGFSSVLDLTERPQVFSKGISFEFDRDRAENCITDVVNELEDWSWSAIDGIPLMRLPFPPKTVPNRVQELLNAGYNTVFRFELKRPDLRKNAVAAISDLDRHTAVFLQNLEELEISLDGDTEGWRIDRNARKLDSEQTDLDFITVKHTSTGGETDQDTFALFSRTGIKIGESTGGIDVNSWGKVDHTRIGVALQVDHASDGIHLRSLDERPFIHVFLPTEEESPIPVLMNGAFYTKISRTSIDVTDDGDNYNAFLLQQISELLATDVQDYAAQTATTSEELLDCLDFSALSPEARSATDTLAGRFATTLRDAFADVPFLPRFEGGPNQSNGVALSEIVVPYYADTRPHIAEYVARIHGGGRLSVEGLEPEGHFPRTTLLSPDRARILEALDATVLEPEELPPALGAVSDNRSPLNKYPEPEDELAIDPILQVLIWVYETISDQDGVLDEFKIACRRSHVFPIGHPDQDGVVDHVAKIGETDLELFFPPKNDIPNVHLPGIAFLSPPVYRPGKNIDSRKQSQLVEDFKPALETIWDVNDFEFEQVARAAVFPLLPSPQQPDTDDSPLQDRDVLELVWQLADESVTPELPLPHIERTQTLHRLCLLPVPTRAGEWSPACRVYFGSEWQPDDSDTKHVEALFEAAAIDNAQYLASPDDFPEVADFDTAETDELDEDESAFDEWRDFFRWLGVSPHIRITPFFDPQTRRDLMSTKGIERPKRTSVLDALSDEEWSEYKLHLTEKLDENGRQRGKYDSIYEIQSIEFFDQLVAAAHSSIGNERPDVATHLFEHVTSWWRDSLQRYRHPVLATHDVGSFGRRNQNCPKDREKRQVGLNLWLWQLKHATWCPSNHGVRRPNEVWLPVDSVRTRFKMHDTYLLPVLPEQAVERARGAVDFLVAIGVRRDLSQNTFRPRDARTVTSTIANTFTDKNGELDSKKQLSNSLRQIKSAYRYVSELLPPLSDQQRTVTDNAWVGAQDNLRGIPVLCRRPSGEFVFKSAEEAYFIDAPDVVEQIPFPDLPIFVLQEPDAVRFGTYFGIRDLESTTEAKPRFIDERPDRRDELVEELERVAPYILCRLEAERQSQELITRDLSGMRSFLDDLELVDTISVEYELSHEDKTSAVSSEPVYYLDRRNRGRSEPAIPILKTSPNRDEQYRHLARALCGALDVSQFEGVVTMLTAADDRQRRDYLTLAGAPSTVDEIESKRRALIEGEETDPDDDIVVVFGERDNEGETKIDDVEDAPDPAKQQLEQRTPVTQERPIYDSHDLTVDGETVTIVTEPTEIENDSNGRGPNEDPHSESSRGGATMGYRTAVDKLGMNITLQYERARLRNEYEFGNMERSPAEYVFEVETEANIEDARENNIAGPVIDHLTSEVGLPLPYPGFDILTVNPETGEADRLIELKSSGHDTRTPGISWNEWKTARTAEVSDQFYLYIVGNLRKDIQADPYIREIPNPFELLRAETEEREQTTKEVKVDITRFRKRAEVRETKLTRQDD